MRVALVPLLLLIAIVAAFSLDTQVIPDSDLRKRVPMTTLFYQDSALPKPYERRTSRSPATWTSPLWLKASDGGRFSLRPHTAYGRPI